jgi:pyruvate/2-oxoglutarate dehydrogenase complex dihydrolipoamide dehydrogenase (E3) component
MSKTVETYDAIIIGSGQGGGPLSTALVAAGRRTALVERADIGGTCINVGCTPTKTMVASAAVAHLARSGTSFGIDGTASVDMPAIRKRKRDLVASFRTGSEAAIRRGGVDIIWGTARFTGTHEIVVSGGSEHHLAAPLIVIDTGGRPFLPRLEGIESVPVLTSTTIMELDRVPPHLVILGGGYVGVEFAQMFRRFGSDVTIIQRGPAVLANEDDDVSLAVAEVLREDGIKILFDATATPTYVEQDFIGVGIEIDGVRSEVTGSHLLIAVGRTPNTEDLGLAEAGVEIDAHGFVRVDERLRTTAEGIYAIGDCARTPPFTHMSYDDFRILRTNIIDGGDRTTTDRPVPYTVFIDPQLGRVGLSESQARHQRLAFHVAKMGMDHVARALESGNSRGFMKVLVEDTTDQILSCAILGMEGGELMAMIEIAMMGKLPYTTLRDAIFAHPTLAESFNNLFGTIRT